jgi:hypothetical protein
MTVAYIRIFPNSHETRKNVVKQTETMFFLGYTDTKNGSRLLLRNVGNYVPIDTVSYPGRTESYYRRADIWKSKEYCILAYNAEYIGLPRCMSTFRKYRIPPSSGLYSAVGSSTLLQMLRVTYQAARHQVPLRHNTSMSEPLNHSS